MSRRSAPVVQTPAGDPRPPRQPEPPRQLALVAAGRGAGQRGLLRVLAHHAAERLDDLNERSPD